MSWLIANIDALELYQSIKERHPMTIPNLYGLRDEGTLTGRHHRLHIGVG